MIDDSVIYGPFDFERWSEHYRTVLTWVWTASRNVILSLSSRNKINMIQDFVIEGKINELGNLKRRGEWKCEPQIRDTSENKYLYYKSNEIKSLEDEISFCFWFCNRYVSVPCKKCSTNLEMFLHVINIVSAIINMHNTF